MIIIDLICESFSFKVLLILITIAQLLRIFVVNDVIKILRRNTKLSSLFCLKIDTFSYIIALK